MASEIQIQYGPCADSTWDEYVKSHPRASFFHLKGWLRVLEKTFSYESFSCLAKVDGRITGVLPLFRVRILPFGHSLVSLPFAVYGGICADDVRASEALLGHAQILAGHMGVRYVEFRNQETIGDLPVKNLYVTFRKEILSDPEKNLDLIPRKQRRMIRQGEKCNLTARVGGMEYLKDLR
jgi:hypothetical protein